MKRLTMYSRPECHLCEVLADELAALAGGRAAMTVIDISDDPELERRYGLRIPVLCGEDGEELSSYPLDRARLERYLAG